MILVSSDPVSYLNEVMKFRVTTQLPPHANFGHEDTDEDAHRPPPPPKVKSFWLPKSSF